jgi:hypothetical protein
VPKTSVATDIHQPLDIHVHFSAKRTLDLPIRLDVIPDGGNFFRREVYDLLVRLNTGRFTDL